MIEEAIKRAIECEAMLYNRKQSCPADQRDRELRWIYHLAEIAPDGPAIECGVYCGGSLVCWAVAREERGPILANDIEVRPGLNTNLARYDLEVEAIQFTSTEVAARMKNNSIAFCFIDADHTEAGIMADVAAWPDKIMPSGVLAFHDYGSAWEPAIKEIVDQWQAEAQWKLLGQVGSLVAFRRPGQ